MNQIAEHVCATTSHPLGRQSSRRNQFLPFYLLDRDLCYDFDVAQEGAVPPQETSSAVHQQSLPGGGQLHDGQCCPCAELRLRAQEGVVSSGNSLDYCQQDWDQMVASSAAIKEMEAAGIAWVRKRCAAMWPKNC